MRNKTKLKLGDTVRVVGSRGAAKTRAVLQITAVGKAFFIFFA